MDHRELLTQTELEIRKPCDQWTVEEVADALAKVFNKGRLHGLKEMDEVSNPLEAARIWPPENVIELERLKKLELRRVELRKEYYYKSQRHGI